MKINRIGENFMKIKGSIWIAVLLFLETVIFIETRYVFPAAVIAWDGKFEVIFLLFWVFHISLLFLIFTRYFLQMPKINWLYLAEIIIIFLAVRIVYDVFLSDYTRQRTAADYYKMARICFYSEVGMNTFIVLLFGWYARLMKYKIYVRVSDWIKISLLFFVIIFCVSGAEYIIRLMSDFEEFQEKDTISYGNVMMVFLFNIFFQNIIAFLMKTILFSVMIPGEQAGRQSEEGSYGSRQSAKRTIAWVLVVIIVLLFVSGISILDFL